MTRKPEPKPRCGALVERENNIGGAYYPPCRKTAVGKRFIWIGDKHEIFTRVQANHWKFTPARFFIEVHVCREHAGT